MPVDLNRLTEGWLELESDPGLFTLLLEDFGVRGVQVEEIYDLQKPIESPVYGFIFLFKWIEERRSRRKVIVTDESFIQDEETVNSIFFAHQIVPNSCATHALLSVLLNCNKIHLGETLTRLMEYTRNMSPENKGYAIGNTPELAKAHNSHAKPEPRRLHEKSHGIPTGRTMEAFHFVSYVPIDGQLFELDGLKPFPINHGPWGEHEDWTEKFRRVMKERLGIATGGELHDIRFNLMAVVPDRRLAYEHKLRTLKTNRQIVLEALQQLVKMTHPELTSDDHAEYIAAMHRSKQQQQSLSSSSSEKNDTSEDQNSTENSNSSTKTTLSTSTNLGNAVLSITSCSTSSVTTSTPAAAASPQSGSSFKMKSVTTRVTSSPAPYIPAHPALDSHNYAKSPLMEGLGEDDNSRPRYEDYSGSDYTSDEDAETHSHVTENDNTDSNAMDDLPQNLRESPADDSSTLKPIHVDTKDYSHPLSIQTKFETSPTPSNSSTDTSSEVGSAFNSPVRTLNFASAQNSPTFCSPQDIRKFVVIRVSGSKDNYDDSSGIMTSEQSRDGLDSPQENAPFSSSSSTASSGSPDKSSIRKAEGELAGCSGGDFYSDNLKRTSSEEDSFTVDPVPKKTCPSTLREASEKETTEKQIDKCAVNVDSGNTSKVSSGKNESKFPEAKREHSKYPQLIEPHTFAPKDLLALLKNVENEITVCESNLRDEIEKRKKYKIDDCRRTHNYDRFICTFLSMLAQQKKLADLVKQHVLIKKRQGINVGRLHKKADRRRRSRPKKRK